MNGQNGDVVETVTSKLKFVHYLHHCVLTCSGKTLPKWLVEITLNLFIPHLSIIFHYRDDEFLTNIGDTANKKFPATPI